MNIRVENRLLQDGYDHLTINITVHYGGLQTNGCRIFAGLLGGGAIVAGVAAVAMLYWLRA